MFLLAVRPGCAAAGWAGAALAALAAPRLGLQSRAMHDTETETTTINPTSQQGEPETGNPRVDSTAVKQPRVPPARPTAQR